MREGPGDRNVLLWLFTGPHCCCSLVDRHCELPRMVAQLRAGYGRHMGEPAWESFIERMVRASAEFAQMWASGDVAPPGQRVKVLRHASVGVVRLSTVSLSIDGMPEHRILVYTPEDDDSRARLDQLCGMEDPLIGCPVHARKPPEYVGEKPKSRAL